MSIIFSQHGDVKAFCCRRSDSRHREPKEWVSEAVLLVRGGMLRSRPQADGSWAKEESLAHRVLICYRKYIGVTKILSSNRLLSLYCNMLNIAYKIKIIINFFVLRCYVLSFL